MSHLSGRLQEILTQFPDRLAIATASEEWTYARLDDDSSRISRALPTGTTPIAILMEHGPELIASIVGIVRAGRPYLVLNPSLPEVRLREIVAEIAPEKILADTTHFPLAESIGTPLKFDSPRASAIPEISIPESAPLGIFYTSGSARQPRPYVYTHGGTWQTVRNHADALALTADDRISLLSPFSAAASVSNLFGALLHGACVLPHQPAGAGWLGLIDWFEHEKPSVLHTIPSLFRRLLDRLDDSRIFPSVRVIKFGGEPLFASEIRSVACHFPACELLINGLGATEANGNICHFRFHPQTVLQSSSIPIGKPLPGFQIRVTDDSGQEMPRGEIGEIRVRSDFASPQIWGTSEPQTDDWRCTGDLGQIDTDGNLHHLGRSDHQFKSNGLWVTPSLVEGVLQSHAAIFQSSCIPLTDAAGQSFLAAFLVWRDEPLPDAALRTFLGERLAPHLLPKRFWSVAELPLLPNGKLDRVQLTALGIARLQTVHPSLPDTAGPLVVQLTRIWESALGVEGIGENDNYFHLGGDSLAAVAIFTEVERLLHRHFPVSVLVTAPTIRKLANLLHRDGWSKGELRLVALELTGNQPPIFCVPGAGTEAFSLRYLAAHFANERPFYAFQPQGLDGREPYLRTVPAMAERYISDLIARCPDGPFVLCGSSFGGVVAVEMAHRLRALGRCPDRVVLFDSRANEYPRRRRWLPPRHWWRRLIEPFTPEFHGTAPVTRDILRQGVIDWWNRNLVVLDIRWPFRKLPRPNALRFLYLRESCRIARRQHVIRPWPGKLYLLRATGQPSAEYYVPDPTLGWNGVALEGLEIVDVQGHHTTLMKEPNLTAMATSLRQLLAASIPEPSARSHPVC